VRSNKARASNGGGLHLTDSWSPVLLMCCRVLLDPHLPTSNPPPNPWGMLTTWEHPLEEP